MKAILAAALTMGVAGSASGQWATAEWIGSGDGGKADINDAGQVVFGTWSGLQRRLARHTPGVGVEYLGSTYDDLYEPRINNSGQVAFTVAANNRMFALRYTDGVGVEALDTLGAAFTYAGGINDSGTVAGTALLPLHGYQDAFRYTSGSGMQLVVPQSNAPGLTFGAAINNVGQIAGTWEASSIWGSRAVRYTPGTGIELLGTLGGRSSVSLGMNERGDVIGWSERPGDQYSTFLYTDAGGMTDLGVHSLQIELTDINDDRWITANDWLVNRGVLWSPETGFVDLNTLLAPGSGIELWRAAAVNNHGQVVAWGSLNGEPGLFRVSIHQLPSPGAGLCLLLLACRRRRGRPG
jgi:probable HAF family extracellular repeat protein